MISFLGVTALLAAGAVFPDPPWAGVPSQGVDRFAELHTGVGEEPHARLRFFFEVTFMKIDIAWIEAYLDPVSAGVVGQAVAVGDYSDGRARALEMALMEGDPMLLRMELAICREASFGRNLIRSAWDAKS